jgi:hypothetical protein
VNFKGSASIRMFFMDLADEGDLMDLLDLEALEDF